MRSSHKSKKKRKDTKKSKKRCRSNSTSSSSCSSSDEWVEAGSEKEASDSEKDCMKSLNDGSNQRDEWMSAPVEFSGYTRDELKKEKKPKDDESKYMLDRLGQTDRELNPYWKDGGSGLPEEVKDLKVSASAVGDHGVEWLRKALRRAKEQAADENRSLEDVVAERWGSLDKLESMIKEAENRSQHTSNCHSEDKDYKKYRERGGSDNKYDKRRDKERYSKYNDRAYQHTKDRDSLKRKFMKPSEDNDDSYTSKKDSAYEIYNKESSHKTSKNFRNSSDEDDDDRVDDNHSNRKEKVSNFKEKRYSDGRNEDKLRQKRSFKKFLKPSDDDSRSSTFSKHSKKDTSCNVSVAGGSGGRWRKNPQSQTNVQSSVESNVDEGGMKKNSDNTFENTEKCNVIETSSPSVFLSADERNELAAKLIKAEIMGNVDLVKKLKSQLEEARSNASEAEKTVILTRTDSKGFTQPLSLPSKPEYGRGRKEKTQTHEGGKRIRYFADDDKYSLQEMFEREKRSTVEDQNEMFARLASKNVGRDESAHDMDDVFEEMVRVKESAGKAAARERDKAIEQHRRSSRAFENCQWCLDGKHLLKHLVVTIGSKVFLCLPPHESLTEGHCLLIPTQHVICSTQLDEDVWEELQIFRKALVQMFLSMDMDVVFFECAMNFPRLPHMMWQCVPLPKESGDVAPIYFKKAILECETEWSSNKKLVDLAGKNVRRAIPRGLPYFAVDFGLQSGFAHVIEDEKLFPRNFAQEIIGGMLDVDHRVWRKPKFQKFEEQRLKIVEFTKWWQPFNSIKKTSDILNK